MEINYSKERKTLVIKISEEIDQHTTDKIRRKIDDEIEKYIPRKVVFDFDNITFMDSSGIGMILGRYKLAKMLGTSTEIINVSGSIKKIFEMSGITRIIYVTEKNNLERVESKKIFIEHSEEEKNEKIV